MKSVLKTLVKKNTPRWIVFIIDSYIVCNTFIIAYLIRFNFSFNFDNSQLIYQMPVVLVAAILSFRLVGSYKGIIRHTGIRDAISVTSASTLLFFMVVLFVLFNRYYEFTSNFTIPISILVIHLLLNVIALISSRYIYKELYHLVVSDLNTGKRVMIYGAGEAGLLTLGVLRDDKENNTQVVGFIDDNPKKAGKKLNGFHVFKRKVITKEFLKHKSIDEIIIAIHQIKTTKLIKLVDSIADLGVEVKIVPVVNTWINGDFKVKEIKKVKIEDLLGREPIAVNNPILQKEFDNKIVLITGAAGSIGSEITRQLANYNHKKLILIDQSESELYNLQQFLINNNFKDIVSVVGNVRDENNMEKIVVEYQPDIIFHAAAYKHVPLMEENPYEAVHVNVKGTSIIANLALKYNCEKFVMISTDKAVNPTNVMGATKRIAEMYINCLNRKGKTKFITTRFGNVLGSNGSVIPLFQKQIEVGGPLTVTHKDITRYFMTIPEACQLVLEAGAMGNGGEIFVFDMGDSIKIFDLALNMINLSGLEYPTDIDIKITGLRPGEKIYEELLATGENTSPTYHEKIMIAKVQNIDVDIVTRLIKNLCNENEKIDFDLTVSNMKQIVPEFISNNSKYQKLDKINMKA